jgi:16S rRNA (cytosine1402-N4)-methyltransferase
VIPESAQPELKILTRGAEKASASEIDENPRAASVRLRAVERIRPNSSNKTKLEVAA